MKVRVSLDSSSFLRVNFDSYRLLGYDNVRYRNVRDMIMKGKIDHERLEEYGIEMMQRNEEMGSAGGNPAFDAGEFARDYQNSMTDGSEIPLEVVLGGLQISEEEGTHKGRTMAVFDSSVGRLKV
jgi:hypothetical protein